MSWTKWSRRFAPKPIEQAPYADAVGSQLSYVAYVNTVNQAFTWYRHNVELAKVCQQILDGTLKRVIVCIPPGMSKSEMFSRLLAAAYVDRYPTRDVGIVSYGAHLAESLAGEAREYFVEAGGKLHSSTSAKGDWKTLAGGRVWGCGFSGPVRGKRFHLGIVDDPHKGPEELESDATRMKFQEWWQRTWLNRQNLYSRENCCIVVVMQRLAENDLVGWLMEQPDADQWTVVCLDAIRSHEPWQVVNDRGEEVGFYPSRVTMWPDWRKPGELLAPEILGPEKLAEQAQNEGAFSAQFLQRPAPVAGAVFQRSWFIRTRPQDVPSMYRRVMGVDLALTEKETADYTVALPAGYGTNGHYYLFRPYRAQAETPTTTPEIAARARATKCQAIGVEAVAFQRSVVQYLRRDVSLVGIPVLAVEVDRDKVSRARGWSPLAKQNLIHLVEDPDYEAATGIDWIDVYLSEVQFFPKKKKDQVDATGIVIETFRQTGSGIRTAVTGGKAPSSGLPAA